MTDPIVDRTVRQLDGYGLNDYVRRATPVTPTQTIPLLLLGCCEAEFTVRSATVPRRLFIAYRATVRSFANLTVMLSTLSRHSFERADHVRLGPDKLNKECSS
jgi:hypothetical protein